MGTRNRRSYQKGYILERKPGQRSWFGRWYRNELVFAKDLTASEREQFAKKGIPLPAEGSRVQVRRQHCERLCEYSDRYRSRRDVQSLLDEKLAGENNNHREERSQSTISIAAYVREFFLPFCEREMKPSTTNGYKGVFRTYVRARVEKLSLRDTRPVDVTNLLAEIHREHGVSRRMIRGCKVFLSSVFAHAIGGGVLEGTNPCYGALIPKKAKASSPTVAYSCDEVIKMLSVLSGNAKVAVALGFFAALRPGEMKGLKWEDFDGRNLHIRRSVWRTSENLPKTAKSVGSVPVASELKDILDQHRRESSGDYVLSSARGACINNKGKLVGERCHLENLSARVIQPALQKEGINWKGFYCLRRGAATTVTSLDTPLAAMTLLRHKNIATTMKHYIKDSASDARRGAEKVNALFQTSSSAFAN